MFDLSGIDAIENQPSLTLRLVNSDTVAVNGGTVAAGGTSRVDNVIVSSGVPEPGTLCLLGLGAAVGLLPRRRV